MSDLSVTSEQILNTEPGTVTGTVNALGLAVACALAEETAHSLEHIDRFFGEDADLIQFGLLSAAQLAHFMVEKNIHGRSDEHIVENVITRTPSSKYAFDMSLRLSREIVETDPDDLDFFFSQIFDQVSRDYAIQAFVVGLIVLIFLTLRFGAEEGLTQFSQLTSALAARSDADEALEQLHEALTGFEVQLLFSTLSSFEEGVLVSGLMDDEDIPRVISVMNPFSDEQIGVMRDAEAQ